MKGITMDRETICNAIKSVIVEVQDMSGHDCPQIEGSTRPARDIEKFNSEIWPAATAMISEKIGKNIPPEENIFYDEKTCEELTLDECVQRVIVIITKEEEEVETAATS